MQWIPNQARQLLNISKATFMCLQVRLNSVILSHILAEMVCSLSPIHNWKNMVSYAWRRCAGMVKKSAGVWGDCAIHSVVTSSAPFLSWHLLFCMPSLKRLQRSVNWRGIVSGATDNPSSSCTHSSPSPVILSQESKATSIRQSQWWDMKQGEFGGRGETCVYAEYNTGARPPVY